MTSLETHVTKYVGAAEFKANCLKLMNEVQRGGEPITVTKRGKPMVVMTAVPGEKPASPSLFGLMKGTITISGDIVSPADPDWEAEWDANNPAELYAPDHR